MTKREAPVRILEASERLAVAFDDLLVVFALELGELQTDPAPVDLYRAVERIVQRVGERMPCTPVLSGVPAEVVADEEHLARMVTGLLVSTCVRAADVRVSVERGETTATVSVAHSGELADDELAQAFGGAAAGGLTLYKVKRLVELHGGTVAASSGGGETVLSFTLPLDAGR